MSSPSAARIGLVVVWIGLLGWGTVHSGEGAEWGDAPEGVDAYPFLGGVTGQFPTCQNVAVAGFILHGATPPQWAYFGPLEDYEGEGNAGGCPFFNPYDADECFQDGDAGLLFPAAYTIQGGVEVPCLFPDTLAADCAIAVWGVDIDIHIVNNGPWTAYFNFLVDWNQDAAWVGSSQCPSGPVPEHVVANLAVPAPYNGPLSALLPVGSGFLVGPNLGFVWTRFSLTEVPVPLPWRGEGVFEGGESEDYLLLVGRDIDEVGEYGDAPEGALAYSDGTIGNFPTCRTVGPVGFVQHLALVAPRLMYFGPASDDETDGNAGSCPAFSPYDLDECFQDGDAGLVIPPAYTMQAGSPVPCTAQAGSLGVVCQTAAWGPDVDIGVTNNSNADAFVNVLMDWSGDGRWSGSSTCPVAAAPEHVLVDWLVPPGYSGPLSALGPPSFVLGPNRDYLWARFTVSEAAVGSDWDGEGLFEDGETEDYLLRVSHPASPAPQLVASPLEFRLHEPVPNPASATTRIRYDLPERSNATLRIYDVSGRLVTTLVSRPHQAGRHQAVWNGRDETGLDVGAGVYFCRLEAGGHRQTRRMVVLR